jgi:two-component system CheB/CheR fusion protein
MCVFTRHNLIDDPPFSKLDLISCRNVLIYLGSVQKNILPLFHYALKPTGFLMLGASEAAAVGDLFSVVDREHRIYARRETARKPHLFPAGARGFTPGARRAGRGRRAAGGIVDAGCAERGGSHPALSKYSPAGSGGGRGPGGAIEIRGKASPYLTLPVGEGELQSHEADSRHGIVPGSREADPAGAAERRAGAAGAGTVRHDGHAGELNVEVVPLEAGRSDRCWSFSNPCRAAAGREPNRRMRPPEGDPGTARSPAETATGPTPGSGFSAPSKSSRHPGKKARTRPRRRFRPTRNCKASTRNWRPPRKSCNPPTKN